MNRRVITCMLLLLAAPLLLHGQDVEWVRHYSGGFGNNAYADDEGNFYMTGYFAGSFDFNGQTLTGAGAGDPFIAKYNPSHQLEWVRQGTSPSWNGGRGIAVDNDGNVFLSGRFGGTASFDGKTVNSQGGNDIFLAKYSKDGAIQWVRSGGGSGNDDWGMNVAVDADGNSYVVGQFVDNATFDGTAVSGTGIDMVIAAYNPSGTLKWVRSGGGSGIDQAFGAATDSEGNIYVAVWFEGSATFSGTTVSSGGSGGAALVKYAPDGSLVWVKAGLEAPGSSEGASVGVDGDDNVYLAGHFTTKITFGDITLTSKGDADIYVAKFSSDGTALNAWNYGGTSKDGVAGFGQSVRIVVKENGRFFIAASYEGTVVLGGTALQSVGKKDILLAGFDPDGEPQWAVTGGGSEDEMFVGLGVDPADNSYLLGNFFSTQFKFGTTNLTRFGGFADFFLAKVKPGEGGGGGTLPTVMLSTDKIDFGGVELGKKATKTLEISPANSAGLTVKSVSFADPTAASKGFKLLSPSPSDLPVELQEGNSLTVEIEFSPTADGGVATGLAIETNDLNKPKTQVNIFGVGGADVLPTATFSTTSIDFGEVGIGNGVEKSFTITAGNAKGLTVEKIAYADPMGSADKGFDIVSPVGSDFPIYLNEGESVEVTLRFVPFLEGRADAELQVRTNDGTTPQQDIPVSGIGASALSPQAVLSTTSLDFGNVLVGQTMEETFKISPGNAAGLNVAGIQVKPGSGSDRFEVVAGSLPIQLNEGQELEVTVRFTPNAEGPVQAVVVVETNDQELPNGEVTVAGNGTTGSGVWENSAVSAAAMKVTPNPMRTEGRVSLALPKAGTVTVELLDISGNGVALLYSGYYAGGELIVDLDARNIAAGTYFCVVEADGRKYSRVVTITR